MTEHRHVIVAATALVEGDPYNLDFTKFMVDPLAFRPEAAPADGLEDGKLPPWIGKANAFAKKVDRLVEAFIAVDDVSARKDIARKLVAFHDRGLLLWPVTLMFGLSTVGKVNRNLFPSVILECHPELAAIRDAFEAADDVGYACGTNKNSLCSAMWKFVVGLRFASGAGIATVDGFEAHHFQLLLDLVRRDGKYDPRVANIMRWAIRNLSEYYGARPGGFGREALRQRPTRKDLSGQTEARPAPPHLAWLRPAWQRWVNGIALLHADKLEKGAALLESFFATVPEEDCASPKAAFVIRRGIRPLFSGV